MATAPLPRRGEIWLVDFDPAVGAEIQKVRPAVVISLDAIGRLPLSHYPDHRLEAPVRRLPLVRRDSVLFGQRAGKGFRSRCSCPNGTVSVTPGLEMTTCPSVPVSPFETPDVGRVWASPSSPCARS